MPSTNGSSWVTSFVLALVKITANGRPCASEMTWCLLPAFALSVGLGPVWPPQKPPAPGYCRPPHGTSRADRLLAVGSRVHDGTVPRHPPSASRVGDASTSSQSRSPSLGAGTPTECPS